MNRTVMRPGVLVIAMAFATITFGAPLAPNHGSIAGSLNLWLRMPEVNYDPAEGLWADLSTKGNDARADVDGFVGPALSSGENATVLRIPSVPCIVIPPCKICSEPPTLTAGRG